MTLQNGILGRMLTRTRDVRMTQALCRSDSFAPINLRRIEKFETETHQPFGNFLGWKAIFNDRIEPAE